MQSARVGAALTPLPTLAPPSLSREPAAPGSGRELPAAAERVPPAPVLPLPLPLPRSARLEQRRPRERGRGRRTRHAAERERERLSPGAGAASGGGGALSGSGVRARRRRRQPGHRAALRRPLPGRAGPQCHIAAGGRASPQP